MGWAGAGQDTAQPRVASTAANSLNHLFYDLSPPCLPTEQSVAEYIRQYPVWNETDLITLRDQFLVFDQNEDGIIDYSELCGAN